MRCRKLDPFAFWCSIGSFFQVYATSTYIECGDIERLEQKLKLERESLGERGSII